MHGPFSNYRVSAPVAILYFCGYHACAVSPIHQLGKVEPWESQLHLGGRPASQRRSTDILLGMSDLASQVHLCLNAFLRDTSVGELW